MAGRQYLIRVAGVDQTRGHRGKFGALGRLREAQATGGLDRPGARGAVRAHSGEYDGDRLLMLRVRQGAKEVVDRTAMAALLNGLAELKDAALESHREAGTGDVDMARLQRQPGRHLQHRHGRVTREDLRHQALALGGQMLNDHERHAAFLRQSVEERVEGFDSPRRRADSHHREWQQRPLDEIIRSANLWRFGGWFVGLGACGRHVIASRARPACRGMMLRSAVLRVEISISASPHRSAARSASARL